MKLRGRFGIHNEDVHIVDAVPLTGKYDPVKRVFKENRHALAVRIVFNDGSFVEFTKEKP